jgi:hypothetical protein
MHVVRDELDAIVRAGSTRREKFWVRDQDAVRGAVHSPTVIEVQILVASVAEAVPVAAGRRVASGECTAGRPSRPAGRPSRLTDSALFAVGTQPAQAGRYGRHVAHLTILSAVCLRMSALIFAAK